MTADLVSDPDEFSGTEANRLISLLAQDLNLIDIQEPVAVEHDVTQTQQETHAQSEKKTEQLLEPISTSMIPESPNEPPPQEYPPADDSRVTISQQDTSGEEVIEPGRVEISPEPTAPRDDTVEVSDAEDQYGLALAYYEGREKPRDFAQAIKWFTEAAEQGYAPAQYKLGVMLSFGQGTQQDIAAAVQWFYRAAQQGYPAAQYSLGVMYATGQGVQTDLSAAAEWYTRAAEQGSVAAQYMLGVIYSQGQGVTRDTEAAIHWYTKAAEQGSPIAQYLLGVLYEKGQGVVQKDNKKSLEWYTKSANRGHADAQYQLAVKYTTGEGVERDYVKGYMWCLLAELNGKDTIWYQNQLEVRMTTEQMEQARRLARQIMNQNNTSSSVEKDNVSVSPDVTTIKNNPLP